MVFNYIYKRMHENYFHEILVEFIKSKTNGELLSGSNDAKHLRNAIDSSGASLLHYAAECGDETITNYLTKSGSKVNLQDHQGRTPLMLATRAQHGNVIKILLEFQADIYICDKSGKSPLQIAIHANVLQARITRLFIAQVVRDCSNDSEKSAMRLLQVNCPLFKAVLLKNKGTMLRCMVKGGSPVNAKDPSFGKTALHTAVKNLDVDAVKALINVGADVNAQDNANQTPIAMLTDFFNHPSSKCEVLKLLIDQGTTLTTCTDVGVMQMYWILRYGDRQAVRMILRSNVDLLARDDYQQTPLHYLASNFSPGIIEEIEHEDMDVNAQDRNGMTALHSAMTAGNVRFVEHLIAKGADVNAKTASGATPTFNAINSSSKLSERVKCVKLFLQHGADPEAEMQYYLSIYNNDAAVNRDLPMLKPIIARLIVRESEGKLSISSDVFQRVKRKVMVYQEVGLQMETIVRESTPSTCNTDFQNLRILKTMSERFCQGLELKILDIFGTSIALVFVTAYAILCVAPPQKRTRRL